MSRDVPKKFNISVQYQCFILALALMLSLVLFVVPGKSDEVSLSSSIVCSISFESPTIDTININDTAYTQVYMQDCVSSAPVGNPSLPIYSANILIPQGKEVTGVVVTHKAPVKINYDFVYAPVVPEQQALPLNVPDEGKFVINETLYESSEPACDEIFTQESIGYCRGFEILTVNLYPVEYLPKTGVLSYYPGMTVKVNLVDFDDKSSNANSFLRLTNNDKNFISGLVENPEQIDSYSEQAAPLGGGDPAPLGYSNGLCDPSKHYDYVIITNNALKDTTGYTYNWTDLLNHRQNYSGLSGTIVTVEDIDACSDYWNATALYNDTAAHMREFCKDAYQDWGTQYILLGGDWRDSISSDQIVPYRLFTDVYETDTYNTMSCDKYFSHLDGNWYDSVDGVWGGGRDSGVNDPYGELFVGRITAYNASMVSNAVSKIINYDLGTGLSDDWYKSVSFWGGDLGWGATSKQYMEEIRLGTDTYRTFTGFEEWNAAHPDNQFNTSERLYHADLGDNYKNYFSASIENNNASIINHLDHSDVNTPFGLPNWAYRYNTKPFFGYSQGCLAGRFQSGYAGCEQLMCRYAERNAFALVLNTGYGYGSYSTTDGMSQYIQAYFWDYFFNNQSNNLNNWQLGKAFMYASDKMGALVDSYSSAWCYSWYSAHFFGDPAQTLKMSSDSNNAVQFSGENPSDGATNVSISTSSLNVTIQDPDGDTFNWSIQTSPSVGSSSGNNAANGSKTCNVSGLAYSTTYTWYVNATDGNISTNDSYTFTTTSAPVNNSPKFSSPSIANGTTNVSVSTSSFSINISDPEGNNFNWTIQTSPNVGNSSANGATNGSKSCNISGLSYGTNYTWYVNATDGNSWRREWYTFATRSLYTPNAPSSFSASAYGRFQINLSWSKGSNADNTYIEWNTVSSWSKGSGTQLYNGTGNSTSQSSLSAGTTRYYQAWSWNSTDNVWSSSYSSKNATTNSNNIPSFGAPSPSNGSANQSLSLTWGVSISDGDGDTFNWTIQCSNGQSNSANGSINGTKQLSISSLSYNTTYTVWVNATDSYNWSRSWFNFTTRAQITPTVPSNFSASAYGRYQINLSWTKGDSADYTYIEWNSTAGSWNRSQGTLLYNSTGASASQSNLSRGTTRYYQAWSWNATDNIWTSSYSSSNATTANNSAPSAGSSSPSDGSIGVSISTSNLSVTIEDPDGDSFNWTIETSPNVGSNLVYNESDGIKYCSISGLSYSTTYTWYVNATDGNASIGETYYFTTESEPQYTPPPSYSSPPLPSNKAPTAEAGGPYVGYVNETIAFDGSGSNDSDGRIVSYSWDFSDGSTGMNQTATHCYSSVGNYTVTLTVKDDDGATGSDTASVTVIQNETMYQNGAVSTPPIGNESVTNKINENNNGIPDVVKEEFGSNITNSSLVENVSISGINCYLVDTNGDGAVDVFYDSASRVNSTLGHGDNGLILIDANKDGNWDYTFNLVDGSLSAYSALAETNQKSVPTFGIWPLIIIFSLVLVCLVIYFRARIALLLVRFRLQHRHSSVEVHYREHFFSGRHRVHFFSKPETKEPLVKEIEKQQGKIQEIYREDFDEETELIQPDKLQTGSSIGKLIDESLRPKEPIVEEISAEISKRLTDKLAAERMIIFRMHDEIDNLIATHETLMDASTKEDDFLLLKIHNK